MKSKSVLIFVLVAALLGMIFFHLNATDKLVWDNKNSDDSSEDIVIKTNNLSNDVDNAAAIIETKEECIDCMELSDVQNIMIDVFRKKSINFVKNEAKFKVNKYNDFQDETFDYYSSTQGIIFEIKDSKNYVFDNEIAFFEKIGQLRSDNIKSVLDEERPESEYEHEFGSSLKKIGDSYSVSNVWANELKVIGLNNHGVRKTVVEDPVTNVMILIKCSPNYIIGLNSNSKPPLDVFWPNLSGAEYDAQLERYLENVANPELDEARLIASACQNK